MKIRTLISILLIGLFSITTINAFGTELNIKVLDILMAMDKGEYKIEEVRNDTEILNLDKWPNKVFTNLRYTLIDSGYWYNRQLTNIAFNNGKGYTEKGSALRSLEVRAGNDKAYIVNYLVYVGDHDHQVKYFRFFAFDKEGKVIHAGSADL